MSDKQAQQPKQVYQKKGERPTTAKPQVEETKGGERREGARGGRGGFRGGRGGAPRGDDQERPKTSHHNNNGDRKPYY